MQTGRKSEGYAKWNKEKQPTVKWRTQINYLEQREETNIQQEKNEETRTPQKEERLKNLCDNFKHSNIWIIGVTEGEEEEQEIENLFEEIMRENFPNLVKEINL